MDDAAHDLLVLDEEIVAWRARAAANVSDTANLVERLLRRASLRGDLEDYVEADQATARWIAATPTAPDAVKWRAHVDARLHRFAAARDLIVHATLLPAEQRPMLVALAQATGDAAPAIAYYQAAVAKEPSPANLSGLAMALADDGEQLAGTPLMEGAWDGLVLPPPEAAAGLLFQWGRLYEEMGQLGDARDRYELAYDAEPAHHEAATHYAGTLALTGDRDRAIEVLERSLAAYPHPETEGMLAGLLATRDPARAAQLARDARDGWERWVAAEPEAFADHAARFYLQEGETRDPARALALAEISDGAKHNAESEALVIQAALEAQDLGATCTAAAALGARPHPTRAQTEMLSRVGTRCTATPTAR